MKQPEIEKKFLVTLPIEEILPRFCFKKNILQGYFEDEDGEKKRIRLYTDERIAEVTTKKLIGYEEGVPIREEDNSPLDDYYLGLSLLFSSESIIWKTRYEFELFPGFIAEVDVFNNLKEPLVVLEVEMFQEQVKEFNKLVLPSWVGKDISDDSKYTNWALSKSVNTEITIPVDTN